MKYFNIIFFMGLVLSIGIFYSVFSENSVECYGELILILAKKGDAKLFGRYFLTY